MKESQPLARTVSLPHPAIATAPHRLSWRKGVPRVIAVAAVLCFGLIIFSAQSNAILSDMLGMTEVALSALPKTQSIVVSPQASNFYPPVAVVRRGAHVTFVNQLNAPIIAAMASDSPASIRRRVASHGRTTIVLPRLGLYHYFDATVGRPLHALAKSEVIAARDGGLLQPRQGWILVAGQLAGLRENVAVPPKQDLFRPKAMVATVGTSIVISNHDEDTHNFVVDPASPAGAAFVVDGTSTDPPKGWRRTFMVQRPGIYHFYCTLHARQMGTAGGWQVVVPRRNASGYRDHNPMEAWVVVLPASTIIGDDG